MDYRRETLRLSKCQHSDMCFYCCADAKAYGAWGNRQMARKIQRLNLLRQYYTTLPRASEKPVQFHFLLLSPTPPQKLV